MVFETIALSVITVLLLLLTLTRKPGHIKLLLALLSAASIASMVFFILMQHTSGNPDAGQELVQLYAPCGIYVLIALFSLTVAALNRRKLQKDKAAKAAAKAEKAAAKAEKTTGQTDSEEN